MKRVDRVIQERKEIMKGRLGMLRRAFAEEDSVLADGWRDIDDIKKYEDASFAAEQYFKMVMEVAVGLFADYKMLMAICEAEGRYHEPPAPGRRKV
jgi:hypothetical protein